MNIKLQKISESYSAYTGSFDITVEVNKEAQYDLIKCQFDSVWRSKAETVKYLEWCIHKLRELP